MPEGPPSEPRSVVGDVVRRAASTAGALMRTIRAATTASSRRAARREGWWGRRVSILTPRVSPQPLGEAGILMFGKALITYTLTASQYTLSFRPAAPVTAMPGHLTLLPRQFWFEACRNAPRISRVTGACRLPARAVSLAIRYVQARSRLGFRVEGCGNVAGSGRGMQGWLHCRALGDNDKDDCDR